MSGFWKWLMRANARGVCACSVLALIGVSAWWGYREITPTEYATRQGNRPPPERDRPSLNLGAVPAADTNAIAYALFRSPFGAGATTRKPRVGNTAPAGSTPVSQRTTRTVKLNLPRGPRVVKADEPKPRKGTHAGAAKGPKPATQPRPKPPAPPVTLTFKGMMTLPDGRTAALIHDSQSKSSRFYVPGDPTAETFSEEFELTLEHIEPGRLTVKQRSGETHVMETDVHTKFRGGTHVD